MFKKRPTASLNTKELRAYGRLKDRSVEISGKIAGNTTLFATPNPTVIVVNGHIVDMDTAQANVLLRVPGSVAVRNEACNIVITDLRSWQRYVQDLADNAADFEAAVIIITSAGYDLKINGVFMKPQLRINLTNNPGIIKLIAVSAGPYAAYEWQQSINNGASWTNLPTTNVANTVVSGLISKTSYLFRFRSIVKNLPSGWSLPVSIVIQNNTV